MDDMATKLLVESNAISIYLKYDLVLEEEVPVFDYIRSHFQKRRQLLISICL